MYVKQVIPGNVEIKLVLVSCYGRGIGCIEGSIPVTNTNVYLYPYSLYLQEYLDMEKQLKADIKRNHEYQAVRIILDPKFSQLSLATKTDEYGRYGFKNVKPGKYYVLSENVTGHRTVLAHFYDDYGYDHPRQIDSPADLEFNKILNITQSDGVYKFESRMNIPNYLVKSANNDSICEILAAIISTNGIFVMEDKAVVLNFKDEDAAGKVVYLLAKIGIIANCDPRFEYKRGKYFVS